MTKPTKGEVKVVKARTRVSRVVLTDRTTLRARDMESLAEARQPKSKKIRQQKSPEKNPLVVSVSRPTRKRKGAGPVSHEHTESLDSKIAIIERMAKRDSAPVAQSEASTLPARKPFSRMTRFVPKPSRQVIESAVGTALLTPFKMQLDGARLASQVARVAGVSIALFGGFLTLFNMHALGAFQLFGDASVAQVIATCEPGTLCGTTSQTTTDATNTQTTTTNQDTGILTTSPTPEADIGVDVTTAELSRIVPVHVTVSGASRVDLIAQSKETGQSVPIGTLVRTTDTLWKGEWNTSLFEDGAYRLKAVISNRYGTYTKEESDEYILRNVIETTTNQNPATTTESAGSVTSTTTKSVTATTTPKITRVEIGMNQPLHGKTTLRTLVSGAQTIKHYTRNTNATEFVLLGAAALSSTGEWRYAFDTTRLGDGTYDIRTVAVFENGTSASFFNPAIVITQQVPTTASSSVPASSPTVSTTSSPLAPTIRLELTKPSPVSGIVDVYTHVSGASVVELYTIPQQSLTPRFFGTAVKQSDTAWRYRADTTNMPNGTYTLFALVRHQYGETKSDPIYISIKNVIASPLPTEEVKTTLETMKAVGEETDKIVTTRVTMGFGEVPVSASTSPVQPSLDTTALEDTRQELEDALGDVYATVFADPLAQYRKSLSLLMYEYAQAQREGDSEESRIILDKVRSLQEELFRSLPSEAMTEDVRDRIASYTESIAHDLRDRAERSEALIRERVGDAIHTDSDADMISDFDEINLYKTNPLVADTDGDGFTDTAEIMGGYDPTQSTAQVPVRFESPRESGITRDDVLAVVSVSTLTDTRDGVDVPKAYISGKALPNSFVTLYIFSTPIVVTVKTDRNGNWNYIFDKTLEDGNHQIYVGMTDNAGKIIAKSNPFSFVKTAEAFTPVDAASEAPVTITTEEPALVSVRSMLAIGSIAIVGMGILLILLGLHVRPKELVPALIPEPV